MTNLYNDYSFFKGPKMIQLVPNCTKIKKMICKNRKTIFENVERTILAKKKTLFCTKKCLLRH